MVGWRCRFRRRAVSSLDVESGEVITASVVLWRSRAVNDTVVWCTNGADTENDQGFHLLCQT
jgi:hypothetical protein